jgi:vacuolar-type H+-ATPase subunit I/STV1
MTLAEIVCRGDSVQQIMGILYRFGCIALENSSRLSEHPVEHYAFPDEEIMSARITLEKIESALNIIDAEHTGEEESFDMPVSLSGAASSAQKLRTTCEEISDLDAELKAVRERISRERGKEYFRSWASSLNIDTALCSSSERMKVLCGYIDEDKADTVQRDDDIMSVISEPSNGKRLIISAFISSKSGGDEKERMETLRSAGFSPVDISPPADDAGDLSAEESEIITKLETYRQITSELRRARHDIGEYLRLSEEVRKCGITGQCAHIACWVPSLSALEFLRLIRSGWNDRCAVRILPAEKTLEERVFRDEDIPSLLPRSRVFAPFRPIIGAYAHPAYRHIDPTTPGALFFLLFFGMMFADTGHGLVLLLIGLLLRFGMQRESFRSAGTLMIYSGIAACVGGLLFGSFFGREDIIEPLLFRPSERIGTFLLLGVVIGIIVISTGIILNVVQTLWRRDVSGAFFSQWGILSLGFYWLCAGIILHLTGNNPVGYSIPLIAAITALPLIAMIAGEILTQRGKGSLDAAETAFRPVEILLGLLSNTVSFVRIAAFGLCHAALMNAVFVIASSGPESGLYRTIVSVEGNIIVIAIEALVVSIQCIRLQFFEFYSKFFTTPGRRFEPLRKSSDSREAS